MSTTPSFSKTRASTYSVLSSTTGSLRSAPALGIVLLTRSSWIFRSEVLEDLVGLGFTDIVCVEDPPVKLDMESFLERFPQVKFLVTSVALNPGEKINLAIEELASEHFLVLWDDQSFPAGTSLTKLLSLVCENSVLCLAPELFTAEGEPVPSRTVPARQSGRFRILSLASEREFPEVLFPWDFSGIYHRQQFLQSGGFDPLIVNPFWQKADWGTRIRFWGDRTLQNEIFRLDYRSALPVSNVTFDASYKTFYLKNLAIRFNGEAADLPFSRFPAYSFRCHQAPWLAWKTFSQIRKWVHDNRRRFLFDSRALVELWEASL
jgi:hypothetical protein